MLRLATPGYQRFSQVTEFEATFGGGEANVSVSLANYGIKTKFITRLPENDIGKSSLMNLRKLGVDTSEIVFGGERMGIYYLETGAVGRGSKVIYDRAHSSLSEIESGMIDWDRIFDDASWFHWTGITPAISEKAAAVCLEAVKAAKQKGIIINTIQAGQSSATKSNWLQLAALGNGQYFQVEQEGNAVAISTPYDKKMAELSAKLDQTRLYYGNRKEKKRQAAKVAASTKLHKKASQESLARRATFNSLKSGKSNFLGEGELGLHAGRRDRHRPAHALPVDCA